MYLPYIAVLCLKWSHSLICDYLSDFGDKCCVHLQGRDRCDIFMTSDVRNKINPLHRYRGSCEISVGLNLPVPRPTVPAPGEGWIWNIVVLVSRMGKAKCVGNTCTSAYLSTIGLNWTTWSWILSMAGSTKHMSLQSRQYYYYYYYYNY